MKDADVTNYCKDIFTPDFRKNKLMVFPIHKNRIKQSNPQLWLMYYVKHNLTPKMQKFGPKMLISTNFIKRNLIFKSDFQHI